MSPSLSKSPNAAPRLDFSISSPPPTVVGHVTEPALAGVQEQLFALKVACVVPGRSTSG